MDTKTHFYLEAIAHHLHKHSGFNPESLGWSIFFKIIQQRMKMCDIDNIASYARLLENSNTECNVLIEAIVIPETWFFRDPATFHALKHIALGWRGNNATLKILSLPCSTGEEPYSIAITLLEAGLMPNQYRLDAADISTVAIAKATQALYTDNAFREPTLDYRNRYFITTSNGYKLQNTISDNVYFSISNLLSAKPDAPYDIIFCRNLLIYFDHATRVQAFSRLYAMLDPNGLLFLGHAESTQAAYHGWIKTTRANIFRKNTAKNSLLV